MGIYFYISIYSVALWLIFLSNVVRLKEKHVVYLVMFCIFLSALRSDSINDDAENYLFYFTDIKNFSSFSELVLSIAWLKIELGFKALLYLTVPLDLADSSITFKVAVVSLQILLLYLTFQQNQRHRERNFSIFLYFYLCFFVFFYQLGIIRFSLAACFILLGYNRLVHLGKKDLVTYLIFIAAAFFHIAVMIFGMAVIYFHYIPKLRLKKLLVIAPFITVLLVGALLRVVSAALGGYYEALWEQESSKFSVRIFIEAFLILLVLYDCRKRAKEFEIFKLVFILFIFFSFVEVYFGIEVLNRFRSLAWMVFLYSLSLSWNNINFYVKYFVAIYAFIFYIYLANLISSLTY